MINFTEEQQQQLNYLGISSNVVAKQIESFKNSFPFLPITQPAKIGDGILKLSEPELAFFVTLYEKEIENKSVLKFVPASGAASRMFKELFAFVEAGSNNIEGNTYISEFIKNIRQFAFYELLEKRFGALGANLEDKLNEGAYVEIIELLISEKGLNYGGLPKGLLQFHKYADGSRTALEEHFAEGAMYAVGKNRTVNLHFTVAPEHQRLFEAKVAEIKSIFEDKYQVNYQVSYSQQLKSTDTIAVTKNNEPFIEGNGTILFRPAGHGALLANLNALDADIIFIKNIDNVVPDQLKEMTALYKKAIGGVLLDIQTNVHSFQARLKEEGLTDTISAAKDFIENNLFIRLPLSFASKKPEEQTAYLLELLNRPIRICGMVENTGEPGGGPFYVQNSNGSVALQIAETSQLDLDNTTVKEHLKEASHFNPVDLVCAVKDVDNKPFNLISYRDDKTGFITNKSKEGRELKAQELPGLWNGAMANWITLFVEVPLITFNPVKTVNDLLRAEHQG